MGIPRRSGKPNVVFILADDMGIGDLGCVNDGLSHTPTLDGLFAEGTSLTRHYAASAVCSPSRASLLTGRYPHRTGAIDTLEWWGLDRLALRERTLADELRASGYVTGLIGKWHLGSFDPRYHPIRRGFDEAVCFRAGMQDYWQWYLEWGETARRSDGRYLTDVWTEEAVAFIERHQHEPFFLHLNYNAPHTPLQAPAEEVEPFLDRAGVPSPGVAVLYGMLARMDRGIACVLQTLRELGLEDDTIVIFTSDNGPDFGGSGDEALVRHGAGLAGSKQDVLEGGIRVPAVVRWPDGLPGAREVEAPTHFVDWLPTVLAMTGTARLPGGLPLDGADALDLLRGERSTATDEFGHCWQWSRYEPLADCNAAIREGDWKLVRPWRDGAREVPDGEWLMVAMYGPEHFIHHGLHQPPFPDRQLGEPAPAMLFDLAADPGEQRDLAALEPARVARMGRRLDAWFADVEAERATIEDGAV